MPGTILDTVFRSQRNVMQELIGSYAEEVGPTIDPMLKDAVWEGIPVQNPQDLLGRDLRFRKRYFGSLAGVIEPSQRRNHFTIVGDKMNSDIDTTGRMQVGNPTMRWAHFKDGPSSKSFGLSWTLTGFTTNLGYPQSMLNLEATKANIKDQLAPILRGMGRNISTYILNSFYADPTNNYRLGTIAAASCTVSTANRTVTFKPTEETSARFQIGQGIDLWTSDGSARINEINGVRIRGFVANRDLWDNEVTLSFDSKDENGNAADAATWMGASGATIDSNGVFVRYANVGIDANGNVATPHHLYTWRDWFKTGKDSSGATSNTAPNAYLLGNQAITDSDDDYINVNVRKEFKSGFRPSVGHITERLAIRQFTLAKDALQASGFDMDTVICAKGIILNIFEGRMPREYEERTNKPGGSLSLGFKGGCTIQTESGPVTLETSKMLEAGVMMGTRRNKNWTVCAPMQAKSGSKGNYPDKHSKIPLIFPFSNFGSNGLLLYHDPTSNMPTEWMYQPGYITMQFGPGAQIPGAIWSGVEDSYEYQS